MKVLEILQHQRRVGERWTRRKGRDAVLSREGGGKRRVLDGTVPSP